MARTNKYTSINFNDIYEKQLPSSATKSGSYRSSTAPSTSSSYSAASSRNAAAASNYRSHLTQGRMLVLSRPVPTPPTSLPIPDQARIEAESDPISLRPFCREGGGSPLASPVPVHERDRELLTSPTSPKPDRFVPPHLRPGFVGKEERPEMQKQAGSRVREPVLRQQQGPYGSPSPGRRGEDRLDGRNQAAKI